MFQTANAEGTKVYFTDSQQLTPDSSAASGSPNLYVAELSVAGEELTSHVTDLTHQANVGLPSETVVVAATEEEGESGSYVYFVANGTLAPGASRGHCPRQAGTTRPGVTCNLYVSHYNVAAGEWEPTPRLVAALSAEDLPDWSSDYTDPGYLTSRGSPNGRYLAFMSDRSLTGYDNEDVSGDGRLDEEVFLYDAEEGTLVCASCDPSGARPTGVFDTPSVDDHEGLGLLVDRDETWSRESGEDHWLAANVPGYNPVEGQRALYQSRYLSNSGRLFFNSADALLPVGSVANEKRTKIEETDTQLGKLEVGIENVYEYEPAEIGACRSGAGCIGLISSGKSEHESVFLDASETGEDVFFLTAEKLVSQDTDTNFDVYDASICGSSCPASASVTAECHGETCQGAAEAPPALPAPARLSFSGSGNVILPKQAVLPEKKSVLPTKRLTRAQKLKKALKACKRDKKKAKR
ncbi:MAG: hypothetical protein ACRD6W_00785, partial [Nitrososphaerales archaeon]